MLGSVGLLVLMVAAGMALRLWRLDLIVFRYDSAEALFRVRDTLVLGHPPLTGIVNSLGFRNPPGLIWLLLPGALVSPWPQAAAAWQAFLALTGVLPLFLVARRHLKGPAWALPVAMYCFLPVMVFGGRSIWAQNLLPSIGAWALWGAAVALDAARTPRSRARHAAFCTAMLAVAVLVHPASVPLLVMAAALFAWLAVRGELDRRSLLRGSLTTVALLCVLLPSGMDWLEKRGTQERAQPEFARQFAEKMPPPEPVLLRARSGLASVFEPLASGDPMGGIGLLLSPGWRVAASVLDFAHLLLAAAGVALALLGMGMAWRPARASGPAGAARPGTRAFSRHEALLAAWLLLPPVAGAFLVARPNWTYFALGLPALLLLAGVPVSRLAEAPRGKWRRVLAWCVAAMVMVGALGYGRLHVTAMRIADSGEPMPGPYYIPLRFQADLACRLANEGVGPGRFHHLAGDWFGRPYDYLLTHCTAGCRGGSVPRWAAMDDTAVRGGADSDVSRWLLSNGNLFQGSVVAGVFDSEAEAEAFVQGYIEASRGR